MSAKDMLQSIGQSLGTTATVKSVFGEPIVMEGITVVPVAKVAYGFGGGFGVATGKEGENGNRSGEGGGGGGGVTAFPVGALEITPTRTRFVPLNDRRWLVGAFAVGALFGRLMWRRRLKS